MSPKESEKFSEQLNLKKSTENKRFLELLFYQVFLKEQNNVEKVDVVKVL